MNKHDQALVRALVLLDRYYRQRKELEAAKVLWTMEPTALASYVNELTEFTEREYHQTQGSIVDLLMSAITAQEQANE